MLEYIEREKAKEVIKNFGKNAIDDGQKALDPIDDILLIQGAVDMIPSADVAEVVHGYWKPDYEYEDLGLCSICNSTGSRDENFCSYCGAKMDGKDGSE